jgi:hypothetical protein
MEVLDPVSLIAGLTRVESHSAAQPEIIHALENIRRVRARVDATEVALHDLTKHPDIHRVVVNNGNIVDSPWLENELNLGRTTRLANRAREPRPKTLPSSPPLDLGRTGCCVKYEFAKPHHLKFWRNGGPTDLINLLPPAAAITTVHTADGSSNSAPTESSPSPSPTAKP